MLKEMMKISGSSPVPARYLAIINPHLPVKGISEAKQVFLLTTSFSNALFSGKGFSKNAPYPPDFMDAILVMVEGAAVLAPDYPKFSGQLVKRAANHAAFYRLPVDWSVLFSEASFQFLKAAAISVESRERPMAVRTHFSEAFLCAEAVPNPDLVLAAALHSHNFEKQMHAGLVYTPAELAAFPLLSEQSDMLGESSKMLYTLGVSFQCKGRPDLAFEAMQLSNDGLSILAKDGRPAALQAAVQTKLAELESSF